MGTYCEVSDVWEKIQIDSGVMADNEIEKRITEAEEWVNGVQDTTYSGTIPELIKYATACYASSLVLDYLYTGQEPNQSNHSKRLINRAKDYLKNYNEAVYEPESGLEKVNSDFFDVDSG